MTFNQKPPGGWHEQLANRLSTPEQLERFCGALVDRDAFDAAGSFPMAITPYYAELIDWADPHDPLRILAVPCRAETRSAPHLNDDPIEEERHSPLPGLIRRYPDRAVLLASASCPVNCRHCTRRHMGKGGLRVLGETELAAAVSYLRRHREIRDVIISGGDPLTCEDDALFAVISAVREVESVDIIRIGTRAPVTLPMRVDDALVQGLRPYQPLYVNTQFNHPRELTAQAIEACARFIDAGIPVSNQAVLLRGVNDDPLVIEELCLGLLRARVRPYYLFMCDLWPGLEHLRTPLSTGLAIMEHLRGRISGLGIPQLIVDLPGGIGKIPVGPNHIIARRSGCTVLRATDGRLVDYPDPQGATD